MSGTSADGIDAAAVSLWEEGDRLRVELRAFETTPYPPKVRDALFRCFEDRATVSELCLLNATLGELFADAAESVLERAGETEPPAFVASHGQTVWHAPESMKGERGRTHVPEPDAFLLPPSSSLLPQASFLLQRGTLQIGEAARIAERLRAPVVCDFRQQDFALGGQGAPLVPYVDYLLFSHPHESRAVQNLGGIGNVTYLRASGPPEEVIAFDTGPANALMDAAAQLVTDGQLPCDRDGLLARAGNVDAGLLESLLKEPFLSQPPPKSTGRELFSARRVREWWDAGYQGPGLVSTLTQFTVETIAGAYRRWLGPVDTVILGGGGARNPELVRRLREALSPAPVLFSEDFGLNGDAKEALAFAVLGYETLRGRPSNVPSATGASRPAVQGKVCLP
jgi:anhydro-N-acetylmuramic acid kinase